MFDLERRAKVNILLFTKQVGRGIIVGTLTIALLYWASRLFCSMNYPGNSNSAQIYNMFTIYTTCVQNAKCAQVLFSSATLPKCPVRYLNLEVSMG